MASVTGTEVHGFPVVIFVLFSLMSNPGASLSYVCSFMWYCIIRLVYLLIWKEVWFITDQLSLEDQNELSSW